MELSHGTARQRPGPGVVGLFESAGRSVLRGDTPSRSHAAAGNSSRAAAHRFDQAAAAEEAAKPRSNKEQVAVTLRLIAALENSRFLPPDIAQAWIRSIRAIDTLFTPLSTVRMVAADCEAFEEYRSRRNFSSLYVSDQIRCREEMAAIKSDLAELSRLVKDTDDRFKELLQPTAAKTHEMPPGRVKK